MVFFWVLKDMEDIKDKFGRENISGGEIKKCRIDTVVNCLVESIDCSVLYLYAREMNSQVFQKMYRYPTHLLT